MPQVDMFNQKKELVGKVELAPWWEEEASGPLMHQSVVATLAARRRGTASCKGRSDVSGGGSKPFRQKGTGRARQGTSRAPHMKGGGVVFGPQPRDFGKSMNKKARRKALKGALALRAAEESLLVLDGIELSEPRTREMVAVMDQLQVDSALLVVDAVSDDLRKASANLSWLKVVPVNNLNTYDVLAYGSLIITRGALEQLEGVLS